MKDSFKDLEQRKTEIYNTSLDSVSLIQNLSNKEVLTEDEKKMLDANVKHLVYISSTYNWRNFDTSVIAQAIDLGKSKL